MNTETELLVSDKEAETEKPVDNGFDLNDFLSQYTEAPKIDTVETPTENNTTQHKFEPVPASGNADAPYGYYRTGKKAGQPRPTPKSVKVSYTDNGSTANLNGQLLTGALLITLLDLAMPIVVCMVGNAVLKGGKKVKPTDLGLTSAQKKELAPIADQVLKRYNINADPVWLLFGSMIGLYATNFAAIKFLGNDNKKTDENTNKETTNIKVW